MVPWGWSLSPRWRFIGSFSQLVQGMRGEQASNCLQGVSSIINVTARNPCRPQLGPAGQPGGPGEGEAWDSQRSRK